jgi:hypothetical protein
MNAGKKKDDVSPFRRITILYLRGRRMVSTILCHHKIAGDRKRGSQELVGLKQAG